MFADLKFALRSLAKNPGFTCISVLTLALGIGLVTIQFSLVSGALYKGLPFERSDRIMVVERISPKGRGLPTPAADYQFWREQQTSFAELAAQRNEQLEISGDGLEARSYRAAALSSGVLKLLGTRPVLGRSFTAADEQTDAPMVVLLGHHVWKNDYAADPRIVGRSIRVRGEIATIIGVMPEGFAYPINESIWTNLRLPAAGAHATGAAPAVHVIGRLGDATTLAAARAEFDVLVSRTEETHAGDKSAEARARILPLLETLNLGDITTLLYSLLGVVGGVLALACLNVSNLLSARALERSHELAIRSALGATRRRIVQQMLVESVLLSVGGALGGLWLAGWVVPLLNRELAVGSRPFWVVIDLDYRVLTATAGLTLGVGLLAGLFPALRSTRGAAGAMLKEAAGGTSNVRLGRLNRTLVTAQVGMSCAVLIATSVLVDAAHKLGEVRVPYNPDQVLSAQLRVRTGDLNDDASRLAFHRALLARLPGLPGVESALLTASYPFSGAGTIPVEAMGAPTVDGKTPPPAFVNPVSPGFFKALHFSLLAGREFTAADGPASERVTVVSESFARRYWPGQPAVGQHVRVHSADPAKPQPWLTVVGVVTDSLLDQSDRRYGIHVPLAQRPPADAVVLLAAASDPRPLARPLRDAVRAISPDVPVDRVFTLAERNADDLRIIMTFSRLALTFGASGLLLAAIGIYGVTSFAVQRRTREFGLRMALGAQPADVLRHVLRQGLKQCAAGLAAGGLLGWAASKPLLGVTGSVLAPPGVMVYLALLASVGTAVLLALWLPARRATKVDPLVALRAE